MWPPFPASSARDDKDRCCQLWDLSWELPQRGRGVPSNGGYDRWLSEKGMAAAFRRMDQARERSRRNVVAYLKAGACPARLLQNNPERSGSSWWVLRNSRKYAAWGTGHDGRWGHINHGRGGVVFLALAAIGFAALFAHLIRILLVWLGALRAGN